MLIVGVDVETTGLDSSIDEIVELGAVLYDTKTSRTISSISKIFRVNKWSDDAELCHKISKTQSDAMPHYNDFGFDPWQIISGDLAKYVVAHNAAHDYAFVTKLWPSFKSRPWICTWQDLNHSKVIGKVSSHRLGHLCVDYEIQLGAWHQALVDAEACAKIAARHDLDLAFEIKNSPKYRLITYGDYIDNFKDLINNAPSVLNDNKIYKWNQPETPRAWSKDGLTIKEVEIDAMYIKEITNGKWKFEGVLLPPKAY